jgi:hypothetical protein
MNSKKIFMILVSVLLVTAVFSQETLWDENEMPCQEYSVGITTNAQYNESENAYLGCYGTTVYAQINFQHNNENYEQTIDNTDFSWKVLGSNGTQIFSGLGLDELSEPFGQGAYFVTLAATDANGCQVLSDTLVLYISVPPTFTGTTATPSVYLGDTVELNGILVSPNEWQINMQTVNNESFCIDTSGIYREHTSCFYFSGFAPNLTITSADDIQSVGVNMEHSYMGDIDVYLQCPNGQRMILYEQACGGGYFGEPVDLEEIGTNSCNDGMEWVGIGYDYYWTMDNNNGLMAVNCPGSSIPLPSGNYLPVDSFGSMVGCPINGEWCLIFVDFIGADDGVVFRTEIHFADYLVPAEVDTVSFQNTYGNEVWWDGESVLNEGYAANNFAVPTTVGQVEYTFSGTDNFGCTYDTTLYVNVLPATDVDEVSDDDILVFPNPVNDMLTITSSEAISEIEIVNDRGQVVRRMDVNGNTAACNVSELASGVYVVRIYNRSQSRPLSVVEGSVVWQRKFVKE